MSIDQRIAKAEADAKAVIERANARLKQLKAQKEAVEQRKLNRLIKGKRAEDNRRKILVGAMILKGMEENPAHRAEWMARLDHYLVRDDERALFGLPPRSQP